jgi:ParB/RepB/Spo0J family partition protein
MANWSSGKIQAFSLETFDERYARYRLGADSQAIAAMVASLRQFGQLSPLVCCLREEMPCVLDGHQRLRAAWQLEEIVTLNVQLIEADEKQAKAAMYWLNQAGRRTHALEEAWLIHALVRDDGLSQLDVAQLLGRHKSWVCRRLALLEKLETEVRLDLQLGLLSPTAARYFTELPRGNQSELLETVRRESLTTGEIQDVIRLFLAASTREQKEFVLEKPREALTQARGGPTCSWDPRLSTAGNRVSRKLGWLLDNLPRMENWLRHQGRGELSLCDGPILWPGFERLMQDARTVAELAEDLVAELKMP